MDKREEGTSAVLAQLFEDQALAASGRTYGSFATAWQVKQDFLVLAGQQTSPGVA